MNSRASKLIPYLSLHDPYYIETTDNIVSWPSSAEAPRSSGCREPAPTDSPESSTTSTQTATQSCSTDKSWMSSPHSGKRQKINSKVHVERCETRSVRKSVKPRLRARQSELTEEPRWAKSVLVRLQPRPDEAVQDLRYTFVKLPGPDIESCAAAICAKIGIQYNAGMPISWADSKTSLRGPFDHAFLQNMPDMQDFVITVQTMGRNGNVGLLLEM